MQPGSGTHVTLLRNSFVQNCQVDSAAQQARYLLLIRNYGACTNHKYMPRVRLVSAHSLALRILLKLLMGLVGFRNTC